MPKLPDAIHVVTAVQSGCQAFVSRDKGIKLPNTMRLVKADRVGIESLLRELR
jgi:predicted nucleic acid-binding protein